jgi:predicted nucleotidyltransferase
MALEPALEQELVRRILTVAAPDRVILFGSAAADTMTQDSDIDLLVVEEAPGNTRIESVKIRRALGNVGYPIDVVVMATERFEETRNVFGGLAYPAHHYGRVLYEGA